MSNPFRKKIALSPFLLLLSVASVHARAIKDGDGATTQRLDARLRWVVCRGNSNQPAFR